MTSIFEASTYEGMAVQIVADVFQTMLDYSVQESPEDYSERSRIVTSAIFYAGEWKGAVVMECSEDQARFFTGRLMGIAEPEHMDEDTRDAMGEIINMIGGNLKPVLPKGVSLSMPSVLEGPDYAYKICGTNETMRLSFRGELGALWVTLVQVV